MGAVLKLVQLEGMHAHKPGQHRVGVCSFFVQIYGLAGKGTPDGVWHGVVKSCVTLTEGKTLWMSCEEMREESVAIEGRVHCHWIMEGWFSWLWEASD